jgi:shikimate dehydrogenase
MMYNETFRLLGIDHVYLCFDTKNADLGTMVQTLKEMNVFGFNLTMPDKERIIPYLDELSPAAQMIGAVNTVKNEDGRLIGHNTDGIGYLQSVRDIVNRRGRSWENAQRLADTINRSTSCRADVTDMADTAAVSARIRESSLLTNATSIGMAPNTDASPIADPSCFHKDLLVSDIIYNPRRTKLLLEAEAAGCPVSNGMYMLLYQGAAAFHIWTGLDMPVDEIRAKFFS